MKPRCGFARSSTLVNAYRTGGCGRIEPLRGHCRGGRLVRRRSVSCSPARPVIRKSSRYTQISWRSHDCCKQAWLYPRALPSAVTFCTGLELLCIAHVERRPVQRPAQLLTRRNTKAYCHSSELQPLRVRRNTTRGKATP
jgi:hypothetical protein